MMKYLIIFALTLTSPVTATVQASNFKAEIAEFFAETQKVTHQNKAFWDLDLYGPILLVKRGTREIYSNFPDQAGALQPDGKIFTGILPDDQNIANTSLIWNGRNWAMVILPLDKEKADRMSLITHELFHRSQKSLGFKSHNPSNNHLGLKEGRVLLRLELEALKKAILAPSANEEQKHLLNALIFRKYRHNQFPDASRTENLLELNEGLARYTGNMMSSRNHAQTIQNLTTAITEFMDNPSYVRSFAYVTTPSYGYLLKATSKNWHKDVTNETNLTTYFINAFQIDLPKELKSTVANIADRYKGNLIQAEETAREDKTQKQILLYKNKFVNTPHLEITLDNMQISFDPRNILPLENLGTVYPNLRVSDNWGILTVENGALLGPNWSKLSLSMPTNINQRVITGDGWKLNLSENYSLAKDENGNSSIQKNK